MDDRADGSPRATSEAPTVILFCGLPGSGKTTLATRLESEGRGIRICTDDWQARLGVAPTDVAFHERLQVELYAHALVLLRHGTDVILEDGLWMRAERVQKFSDARSCGARIELNVFDVDRDTLWSRLRRRNAEARAGAYPITEDELDRAWHLFERPGADELALVDEHTVHRGGQPAPTP